MKGQRSFKRQDGFTLVYLAGMMTVLLLFTGLSVDGGRAYVVKAQLTKAVDGAALGAARSLNSGNPRAEAERIFKANFPAGWFGTSSSTDPTTDPSFYSSSVDETTGVNTVTVRATAVLPTTFMQLANYNTVTVNAMGEATRRMVDLSLVLDVSSSIGSKWTVVRDAARDFINAFDQSHDRLALLTFSHTAKVLDAMPSSRGFNKPKLITDVPSTLPGGSTNMVEGFWRGWDELRAVPTGSQSGLRIIVLFTDGASNGIPGNYGGVAKSIRTWDFPHYSFDPDAQTHDAPHIEGMYDTYSGTATPVVSFTPTTGTPAPWNGTQTAPGFPLLAPTSYHPWGRAGTPTTFALKSDTLKVNGVVQSTARPLRHVDPTTGRYPTEVWNINNSARNVLEIIANEARSDTGGDYRIRIYTLGMGYMVTNPLGTIPGGEPGENILKRIANDKRSPDYNSAQLEGMYFYAPTADDVAAAFQGIQNQILRLSK